MRSLMRNKQTMFYARYVGKSPILDNEGRRTGEWAAEYENPVQTRLNISAAKGASEQELFGAALAYDKTLCFVNGELSIDEYTVFWVDVEPELKDDGTTDTPYDYRVASVARSLNNTTVAIAKVVRNG